MSLYLHPENVKIIWNAIQSFPLFNELLNDPQSKELWFKDIVSKFNDSAPSKLSSKMLYELNIETITYMIKDLKTNQFKYRTNLQKQNQQFSSIPARENNLVVGSDMDTMFIKRQKEYEDMKNEFIPKAIDFSGVTDEPITNINELLEKHKNDRDRVLAYDHNEENIGSNLKKIKIHNVNEEPRIKISKDEDEIVVADFLEDEVQKSIVSKRHVNWNDDISIKGRLLLIEKKFDQLLTYLTITLPTSDNNELIKEFYQENESINFFTKSSYS